MSQFLSAIFWTISYTTISWSNSYVSRAISRQPNDLSSNPLEVERTALQKLKVIKNEYGFISSREMLLI